MGKVSSLYFLKTKIYISLLEIKNHKTMPDPIKDPIIRGKESVPTEPIIPNEPPILDEEGENEEEKS